MNYSKETFNKLKNIETKQYKEHLDNFKKNLRFPITKGSLRTALQSFGAYHFGRVDSFRKNSKNWTEYIAWFTELAEKNKNEFKHYPAQSPIMIGYKVMPIIDGNLTSGPNKNIGFDLNKNEVIRMPGKGFV